MYDDTTPSRIARLIVWVCARTIGAKVWREENGEVFATIRHDGGKCEPGYPYVVSHYGKPVYYAPDTDDAIRHAVSLARY